MEPRTSGYRQPGRSGNGHRTSNRNQPINLANNAIYNQLELEADLKLSLGVSMCFYVNKLNHKQLDDLIESFPDNSFKPSDKRHGDRPINWFSTISYSPDGKRPSDIFKESINIYDSFELEKESKRVNSYGVATLSMDFSKLPLFQFQSDDGALTYPFGILFFSDLNNTFDNFKAVISTMSDRKRDAQKCPYITPVQYDHRGKVSCTGKFRLRGNFIVFYTTNEIEKQENQFFPDITIINIPVSISRDQKNWNNVNSTYAYNIRRMSNCVVDFVEYIIKDIFGFYGFTDPQPLGEIIHAFGYDPVEYNYPPSISDERSKYYGGNRVVMGTKGNFSKREQSPYPPRTDLFSYLNEKDKKQEVNVVISPIKSEAGGKESQQANKKRDKKGGKGETKDDADIQNVASPQPTYSEDEINAALDSSPVTDGEDGSLYGYGCSIDTIEHEGDEVCIDDGEVEVVHDTQIEESPQGENTNEGEVITDGENQEEASREEGGENEAESQNGSGQSPDSETC
jgi:hypothetical protein